MKAISPVTPERTYVLNAWIELDVENGISTVENIDPKSIANMLGAGLQPRVVPAPDGTIYLVDINGTR